MSARYDVTLEHEGTKHSVASLTRQFYGKTWLEGLLSLDGTPNIPPGARATLVLKPVKNMPEQRIAVTIPYGVSKRGQKVTYKVAKRGVMATAKDKMRASQVMLMAALMGAPYMGRRRGR